MAHKFLYLRNHRSPHRGNASVLGAFAVSGGLLVMVFAFTLLGLMGAGLGVYAYLAKDLTPPETIVTREVPRSTKIFDRKGRLLYEVFDPQLGRRTTVPLRDISPYLIQASIATEDATFYENQGINIRGILRAAWNNLTQQQVIQGGSSITQQLAKNVLIPEEERSQLSVVRKLKEAILSLELTRHFTKEQILEYYLNEIYYGNLSYGVEAAAQSYFGKSARDLDLAEAAMLAGLPQAPAHYSPLVDPERAERRQHAVLDLMVRQGFISQVEADTAKAKQLQYQSAIFDIRAPHFVMYVRNLLEEKYGARALYRSGLRVTTTLDLDLQELGESLVKEQVEKTSRTINAHNAALVALDPGSGAILAMVGSVNYFDPAIDGQVNLTTAERQPGSSFKPFTYVTAFTKGYTPATMLLDVPVTIRDGINPPYSPQNVDKKFHGPVSVREAFANSMNIPAIKTIEQVGVEEVLETAHRMGITTLNRKGWYGLSLTLGGGEVKLLDLTYAYGVFAAQGKMAGVPVSPESQGPGHRTMEPLAILKIEDANGKTLEDFSESQEKQVISPELAYLVTDILSDNAARAPLFGNTLRLPKGRPAAVKTGTTEDLRDFWTVGYTPELAVGVWMGNANNTKLTGGFSSTTTGPIWEKFMAQALDDTPVSSFPRPPGIVTGTVCVPSGLLPGPLCPKRKQEIFIRGQAPSEVDSLYKSVRIDKTTGKLATGQTPPQNIEEKVYLVLPKEAQEWAKQNGIEQPSEDINPIPFVSKTILTLPTAGSVVRGTLVISGSAAGDDMEQFKVELGKGLTPTEWIQVVPSHKEPIENGVLGRFETGQLSGLYTLRLSVLRRDKGLEQLAVPITLDNTKPSVRILTPIKDALLVMDGVKIKDVFGIRAEASDEYGIAKVEFYVDGSKIGTAETPPYDFQWRLSPGTHALYAVASDRAGNTTRSETVAVQVNTGS